MAAIVEMTDAAILREIHSNLLMREVMDEGLLDLGMKQTADNYIKLYREWRDFVDGGSWYLFEWIRFEMENA